MTLTYCRVSCRATGKLIPVGETEVEDEKRNNASRRLRVMTLLSDRQWHRTAEIESAEWGGSQGTRRVRELRQRGATIQKRRVDGSTQWEYRLADQSSPVANGKPVGQTQLLLFD